jgi:HEAT repeats
MCWPSEPQAVAAQPVIEWHGDRLSVQVRNAPWAVVLRELERPTGIRMQVKGPLPGTLTQEFEALPLEQGLRRLFRGLNSMFLYAAGTHAEAAAGALTQVWLWPKEGSTAGERQASRPPAPPATARQQDEVSSSGIGSPEAGAEPSPTAEEGQPEDELVAAEDAQGEPLDTLPGQDMQDGGEVLQQAVFDPDPTVQLEAFALLAEQDPRRAVAILVEAAQNDQSGVRLQALQLLHHGGVADDATVRSTLADALTDADIAVKRYAIEALAERGGPEALGALRYALRDPDPSIRQMVIERVIQSVPPEQSLPILREGLADEDATVRSFSAAWLTPAISEGR